MLPTVDIRTTGEKHTFDGVEIEFQMAPGTEAPAEMHFYFPKFRALCMAENATHNLHNLLTLRGALVRDPHGWAGGIVAALKPKGILFLYDEHPVAACLDQMLHWHESYFDTWPVGRLIHALGGAGLALELLEELPDPNRWGRREVRVLSDKHLPLSPSRRELTTATVTLKKVRTLLEHVIV